MSTAVDEKVKVNITNNGDHDKFSHYIKKKEWVEGYMGQMVTAVCGKQWVPDSDPQNYEVCPTCKEIVENLPDGEPEN